MRKHAFVDKDDYIKKVMIYQDNEGVYIFQYDTIDDTHCNWDLWFPSIDEAQSFCEKEYFIGEKNWIIIDDPKEGCFHDIIEDIKIK